MGPKRFLIEGNIFDGPSGGYGKSRGYITFRSQVYDIKVVNNAFLAPEEKTDSPNWGVVIDNLDKTVLVESDNVFLGNIAERIL